MGNACSTQAELHTDTKPEQSNMEENGEYGSI